MAIIVNETTRSAVPEYIYRELDRVRVKGKDKPVTIYEPIGRRDQIDGQARKELKLYHEALKLYRHQNWDMAEIQFINLQQAQGNGGTADRVVSLTIMSTPYCFVRPSRREPRLTASPSTV